LRLGRRFLLDHSITNLRLGVSPDLQIQEPDTAERIEAELGNHEYDNEPV
jgi:hypothetical protein